MSNFVAVYDACVLHPAQLRNLLLRLARTAAFRAKWTERIHEEWMRSVLKRFPDIKSEQLERVKDLMNKAVPDCLVRGHEGLEADLELPDPDDRHVLAAAILSHAGVIVTYNTNDFPAEILAPHGIEAQHPDDFITHLFGLSPVVVCSAVREHRESLKKPTKTVAELLDMYLTYGLATTVAALEGMQDLL